MFFFRNKHIMIDLGTRKKNRINWALKDEHWDSWEHLLEDKMGQALVIAPKDYSTKDRCCFFSIYTWNNLGLRATIFLNSVIGYWVVLLPCWALCQRSSSILVSVPVWLLAACYLRVLASRVTKLSGLLLSSGRTGVWIRRKNYGQFLLSHPSPEEKRQMWMPCEFLAPLMIKTCCNRENYSRDAGVVKGWGRPVGCLCALKMLFFQVPRPDYLWRSHNIALVMCNTNAYSVSRVQSPLYIQVQILSDGRSLTCPTWKLGIHSCPI